MDNGLVHEFELYSFDEFKILLDHEVNRSRRFGEPLTLIHLFVEASSSPPDTQHGAEVFVINALNVHLRAVDIPCKKGNEFLAFMPNTDQQGGRIVCQRLEKLFKTEAQVYDKVSFKLSAFIGMATLAGDQSISSERFMQNAEQAMENARKKQLINTVIFSEMKT